MSTTTTVTLKPLPGFCIKSTTVQSSIFHLPNANEPITIPLAFKIFANIAWDTNVPPPPQGTEEIIQKAMQGQDVDEQNPDGWYVPVLVSNGRLDTDKAGKPSLVFDCIYNTSVKMRSLTDPHFKLFLIELALQRIEAQSSLVLSRQIGTPNIASKGKLLPRTVNIPSTESTSHTHTESSTLIQQTPLIQEVPLSGDKPKGILKSTSLSSRDIKSSRLRWSWSKEGAKIQIKISVPNLHRSLIEQVELDVEPRRFLLQIPEYPILDVNMNLSDAEIVATSASQMSEALSDMNEAESNQILTLKRQRPFHVSDATSEWRIAENTLTVFA
ncbi:hypothetical protein H0H93_015699 [Arthromyces matolae]|nr:hypothetical protein H0H93_015699 [Arthromyces matolae]